MANRLEELKFEVVVKAEPRLVDVPFEIGRVYSRRNLRQALLRLEGEKAELEKTVVVSRRPILIEAQPNPKKLSAERLNGLRKPSTRNPTSERAAPILRTLIDEIVLHRVTSAAKCRLRCMASLARCVSWPAMHRLPQTIG